MDLPIVGQPTGRLRPGDRASRRSRHFDPPGQPCAYSAGQAERFYGVVTKRAGTFFWVHYDGDLAPLKAKWDLLRLEKLGLMWDEQPPPLQQRPTETIRLFKYREKNDLRRRRRAAVADAMPRRRAASRARELAARPPAAPPAALPPGNDGDQNPPAAPPAASTPGLLNPISEPLCRVGSSAFEPFQRREAAPAAAATIA